MIILSVIQNLLSSFNYCTAVILLLAVFGIIYKVVHRT